MTAPARPRHQPASRTRQRARATTTTTAPATPGVVGSPRRRSSAAERAYARRAQRVELLQRRESGEPQRRTGLRLRWPRSRASFVLMLMALMAAGVATTLWLSTQAITDSYRLEELRQSNAALAERSAQLQRQVATAESPASLAERAKALGMVPGGNPARLVVGEDGSVTVVGEPTEATTPAPPPPPAPEPADRPEEPRQPATDAGHERDRVATGDADRVPDAQRQEVREPRDQRAADDAAADDAERARTVAQERTGGD
ncbi:septum formation initiator [Prauserella oleivorans]|uniref:Septum formation initiator n=1 Tax=Prauserella oleivorans TaxID=1478153 RepID=A0ABW5W893_9PSEU